MASGVSASWSAGDTAVLLWVYELALRLEAVQAQVQPAAPKPDPGSTDTTPTSPMSVAAPSSSTASVMACIRDHESGNYAESSHPSSGSGAYQYIGSTWRVWFQRWRDAVEYVGSDYDLAYEAPPLIQDAVTAYAIEHGGAHNWDPSYGNDPCTVGLP